MAHGFQEPLGQTPRPLLDLLDKESDRMGLKNVDLKQVIEENICMLVP